MFLRRAQKLVLRLAHFQKTASQDVQSLRHIQKEQF